MKFEIKIQLLRMKAQAPQYKSAKASGFDLHACLNTPMVILRCRETWQVPTGIAIQLPPDHEGQVRPRSGLASGYGVTVANAPGTIDEDYTGEIFVLLVNHGDADYRIDDGERIAQLVVVPIARPAITIVNELPETLRGSGGFGSTGRF